MQPDSTKAGGIDSFLLRHDGEGLFMQTRGA